MRILTLLLLISGTPALWGQTLASGQNAHASFSIVISTDKPVVKAGSDLWIKVRMTNISHHVVDCTMAPSNGLDRNYQYDVRDTKGNPAVRVVRAHPELGESGSILPCTLNPGQSTPPADNRISRLYNFSRPGTYVIQVSRDDPKEGLARSNKITVTVEP